jgi:hypothetical protein
MWCDAEVVEDETEQSDTSHERDRPNSCSFRCIDPVVKTSLFTQNVRRVHRLDYAMHSVLFLLWKFGSTCLSRSLENRCLAQTAFRKLCTFAWCFRPYTSFPKPNIIVTGYMFSARLVVFLNRCSKWQTVYVATEKGLAVLKLYRRILSLINEDTLLENQTETFLVH